MIVCIPADKTNKLFLKDFRQEKERLFVKYKSTYNDIPFQETEIYIVDENFVITGDDGTVLYRFSPFWIEKLKN